MRSHLAGKIDLEVSFSFVAEFECRLCASRARRGHAHRIWGQVTRPPVYEDRVLLLIKPGCFAVPNPPLLPCEGPGISAPFFRPRIAPMNLPEINPPQGKSVGVPQAIGTPPLKE